MKRRVAWIVVLSLGVAGVGLLGDLDPSAGVCKAEASARQGSARRALIIGIDGLSGAAFQKRAFVDDAAPALRSLAESGRYTVCESPADGRCALAHDGPNADARFEWRTAPGWLSVITGVDSTRHRVTSNDHMLEYDRTRHRYPSFFRLLKQRGFVTAAGGVSTFVSSPVLHPFGAWWIGLKPGIVDYENGTFAAAPVLEPSWIDYRYATQKLFSLQDANLAEWLTEVVACGDADVIMAVFDLVDSAGHDYGFGDAPGYLRAITEVDRRIGAILASIRTRTRSREESWLIVVTSDHGGHTRPDGGGNHSRKPEDQRIPFIVAAIPPLALERLRPPVTQMDVFPTLLAWFGVEHGPVDGTVQGIRPSSALGGRRPGELRIAASARAPVPEAAR